MKLLVIDNYDSFTYNLVHFLGELGAEPVVHRNDRITLDEIDELAPEAIVLSPGPCTPNEAGICLSLIDRFAPSTPILGVCLGHQCIGHSFGGEVVRNSRIMHGKVSPIHHDGRGGRGRRRHRPHHDRRRAGRGEGLYHEGGERSFADHGR